MTSTIEALFSACGIRHGRRLCAWDLGAAERPQVVVKRGEQRGDGSSRETVMRSQDTLILLDLATPWRGSAVRKDLEAKRPI